MKFDIIPSRVVTISNGDDELYHILSTGFEEDDKKEVFLCVDVGPHYNGDIVRMSRDEILEEYGIDIRETLLGTPK